MPLGMTLSDPEGVFSVLNILKSVFENMYTVYQEKDTTQPPTIIPTIVV